MEMFVEKQLAKNEKRNIFGGGEKDPKPKQPQVDENGNVVNSTNGGGVGDGDGNYDDIETSGS